jgi:xanthine dehydrogenase accessory factor
MAVLYRELRCTRKFDVSYLKLEEPKIKLHELIVVIKGAGEMASAVAWRIYMCNMHKILMLEIDSPLAVRRKVSFCEAVHEGRQTVEGVEAIKVEDFDSMRRAWARGKIAVAVDSEWKMLDQVHPDVVVDAILAKKNLGTRTGEAELVVGLGPGFTAGEDVHLAIETNRGHNLGRIITCGSAEANTGVPGAVSGLTEQRVLRAPCNGEFHARCSIGKSVKKGDSIGTVAAKAVEANIEGVLRGLIRSPRVVQRGLKIGDIDPRGNVDYCYTISDKGRAIAGSVLEAILRIYN